MIKNNHWQINCTATRMQKENIVIVGGGITGLYCAWKLADKFNITLLEARDRFGGRIHSISSNWGIIEAGAEFVHGKATNTLALLKKAGIKTNPVGGKFLQNKNGQWIEEDDPHPGFWEKMMEQLATVNSDETLGNFLNKNFAGESLHDFRARVRAYAEGFDVADPDKVSAKALYNEWSHEGDGDLRIEGGYSAVINFLLYELKGKADLRMNNAVKRIDPVDNTVQVILSAGEKIIADKVLITVPVSLLAEKNYSSSIQFPVEMSVYQVAAGDIGFGGVIKIIMECSERFWQEDIGFVISNEVIPTWWTQLPSHKPILTGWVGGTKAAKIKDATKEQIKSYALQSLSAIFRLPVTEIENKAKRIHIFNWFTDPWTKGAYSYDYPQTAAARSLLQNNFEEKIWFAGEALYSGPHPGTVEAALTSAEDVIGRLLL